MRSPGAESCIGCRAVTIRIDIEGVTLDYPVYGASSRTLRSYIASSASGGRIRKSGHDVLTTRALNELSLSIIEGQRVGLIGTNGSGKSTLLRLIAGVLDPTEGSLKVKGAVRSLFDLSFGMDEEATGYENIFIRGLLIGVDRREIARKVDAIAEFADLGEFMHMPVRTYSSGMRLRLAFAVCTSFPADIILLDEVFGVGDQTFFEKATERLNHLVGSAGIVLLASHSLGMIRGMCDRVVWINRGELRGNGPCEEVITEYEAFARAEGVALLDEEPRSADAKAGANDVSPAAREAASSL